MHTRASDDDDNTRTTRKRRDTCDLSRGTATTEPFETSTSRRAPSSRSPRRSEPSCRYIALSLLSLFLSFSLSLSRFLLSPSFSLFPPYCSSIILSLLLPPFRWFLDFSVFCRRYSRLAMGFETPGINLESACVQREGRNIIRVDFEILENLSKT